MKELIKVIATVLFIVGILVSCSSQQDSYNLNLTKRAWELGDTPTFTDFELKMDRKNDYTLSRNEIERPLKK